MTVLFTTFAGRAIPLDLKMKMKMKMKMNMEMKIKMKMEMKIKVEMKINKTTIKFQMKKMQQNDFNDDNKDCGEDEDYL